MKIKYRNKFLERLIEFVVLGKHAENVRVLARIYELKGDLSESAKEIRVLQQSEPGEKRY